MATISRVNGWARPTDSANVQITGRTLTHYTVSKSSVESGYAAVDSDFEKIVRAIQTVGSIELLGTPSSGAFRVAISGAAPAAATTAGSLEGIVNVAVSGTTVAGFTY
jgi:hypothetical protein